MRQCFMSAVVFVAAASLGAGCQRPADGGNSPLLDGGEDAGSAADAGGPTGSDAGRPDGGSSDGGLSVDWFCAALSTQPEPGGVFLHGQCTCSAGYDQTPAGKCLASSWRGTPVTCQAAQANCGNLFLGDGGALDCGQCISDQRCDRGRCSFAVPNRLTCAQLGFTCGVASDGTGGLLSCGTCAAGKFCASGQCWDAGPAPLTCAQLGLECGAAGDGLGGVLDCGSCADGGVCGGAGFPGHCGPGPSWLWCQTPGCTPHGCLNQGAECGVYPDGCGGILQCGGCSPGESCGGGGVPGRCGLPGRDAGCGAGACASLGCGLHVDDCGAVQDCGACTDAGCTPASCLRSARHCGAPVDTCLGLTLDCGRCTRPTECLQDPAGWSCAWDGGAWDGGC